MVGSGPADPGSNPGRAINKYLVQITSKYICFEVSAKFYFARTGRAIRSQVKQNTLELAALRIL
tara:strand:+ start:129 stop:320 length:192 start_codon:yes stop_codon:yes gene_type:complete